jgi:hypothetical protein
MPTTTSRTLPLWTLAAHARHSGSQYRQSLSESSLALHTAYSPPLTPSRIVDGAQKKYRRPSAVRNSVYALTIREHSPERVAENSELACSLPPSLLARVSALFLRRTQETLPDFWSLQPLRPSEQQIFSTCRTRLRGAGGGVVNLVTMRRQGPLTI